LANVIDTLLVAPRVIPTTRIGLRGPNRHAYDELIAIQAVEDPELASPYLKRFAWELMERDGALADFTMTIRFPKYDFEATTTAVGFNDTTIAIQVAVDSAMNKATILSDYRDGDIEVGDQIAGTAFSMKASGDSVNGLDMTITTNSANSSARTIYVGTMNRPAEAVLDLFSVVGPVGDVTRQGSTPTLNSYEAGDNPFSFSPGLKDMLIREIELSEDLALGEYLRSVVGCV
jgi:hypothetical protein